MLRGQGLLLATLRILSPLDSRNYIWVGDPARVGLEQGKHPPSCRSSLLLHPICQEFLGALSLHHAPPATTPATVACPVPRWPSSWPRSWPLAGGSHLQCQRVIPLWSDQHAEWVCQPARLYAQSSAGIPWAPAHRPMHFPFRGAGVEPRTSSGRASYGVPTRHPAQAYKLCLPDSLGRKLLCVVPVGLRDRT